MDFLSLLVEVCNVLTKKQVATLFHFKCKNDVKVWLSVPLEIDCQITTLCLVKHNIKKSNCKLLPKKKGGVELKVHIFNKEKSKGV